MAVRIWFNFDDKDFENANSSEPVIKIEGTLEADVNYVRYLALRLHPHLLNIGKVSAAASSNRTTFEYSGKHDQGNLPELRSSGSLVRS